MKKLREPQVSDINILRTLSINIRLNATSYPKLMHHYILMQTAYTDYVSNGGNPWNIANVTITEDLKIALHKHFKQPPNGLEFISILRKSSPEVCPMCGGFNPTELDHLLPREDYPAWTIFSKNLIPACSCNNVRGRLLMGAPTTQARVLHPYFDLCLQERILTTTYTHSNNFNLISAEVSYVNDTHPEIESIKYHTQNVVIRNRIDGWINGQLNSLMEFPANIVKGIPRKRLINRNDLLEKLEDLLDGYDNQTGSKNNWNSILIHGLLHAPHLHDWLVDRHNLLVSQIV